MTIADLNWEKKLTEELQKKLLGKKVVNVMLMFSSRYRKHVVAIKFDDDTLLLAFDDETNSSKFEIVEIEEGAVKRRKWKYSTIYFNEGLINCEN